jgi:DNA-directed RNA polymerase subunit beta
VRVLRENGTEVELKENIDYGDSEYRYEIEGDRKFHDDLNGDSLGKMGYQAQEFQDDGDLVSVEDDADDEELDSEFDADAFDINEDSDGDEF